jgi:hypothetical protein
MVVAEGSECHNSSPALSHRERGISQVVPRHASIALLGGLDRMRVDREKCDSCSGLPIGIYRFTPPRYNEQGEQLSRRWSCLSRWLVISAPAAGKRQ